MAAVAARPGYNALRVGGRGASPGSSPPRRGPTAGPTGAHFIGVQVAERRAFADAARRRPRRHRARALSAAGRRRARRGARVDDRGRLPRRGHARRVPAHRAPRRPRRGPAARPRRGHHHRRLGPRRVVGVLGRRRGRRRRRGHRLRRRRRRPRARRPAAHAMRACCRPPAMPPRPATGSSATSWSCPSSVPAPRPGRIRAWPAISTQRVGDYLQRQGLTARVKRVVSLTGDASDRRYVRVLLDDQRVDRAGRACRPDRLRHAALRPRRRAPRPGAAADSRAPPPRRRPRRDRAAGPRRRDAAGAPRRRLGHRPGPALPPGGRA